MLLGSASLLLSDIMWPRRQFHCECLTASRPTSTVACLNEAILLRGPHAPQIAGVHRRRRAHDRARHRRRHRDVQHVRRARLRPIDLPDAGRIVRIWTDNKARGVTAPVMSVRKYKVFAAQQTTFSSIAASNFNAVSLMPPGGSPQQLTSLNVTADSSPRSASASRGDATSRRMKIKSTATRVRALVRDVDDAVRPPRRHRRTDHPGGRAGDAGRRCARQTDAAPIAVSRSSFPGR